MLQSALSSGDDGDCDGDSDIIGVGVNTDV